VPMDKLTVNLKRKEAPTEANKAYLPRRLRSPCFDGPLPRRSSFLPCLDGSDLLASTLALASTVPLMSTIPRGRPVRTLDKSYIDLPYLSYAPAMLLAKQLNLSNAPACRLSEQILCVLCAGLPSCLSTAIIVTSPSDIALSLP
jgi:hypothetical protein